MPTATMRPPRNRSADPEYPAPTWNAIALARVPFWDTMLAAPSAAPSSMYHWPLPLRSAVKMHRCHWPATITVVDEIVVTAVPSDRKASMVPSDWHSTA